MGDAAEKHEPDATPEPDPGPKWKRLDAWSKSVQFPTVDAGARWLKRAGIRIYDPPGNLRFVDLDEVHAFLRAVHDMPRRLDEPPNAVVYVLRAQGDGPVKIGFTGNLPKRLHTLRASSPIALELLAVVPGGLREEQVLHEKFACLRRHGEWFDPAPELLSFVEGMRWGDG